MASLSELFKNMRPGQRWVRLTSGGSTQLSVASTWTTSTPQTFSAVTVLGDNRGIFDALIIVPMGTLNTTVGPSLVELKATQEPLAAWADEDKLIPIPITKSKTTETAVVANTEPLDPGFLDIGPCKYLQFQANADGNFDSTAVFACYARSGVPIS